MKRYAELTRDSFVINKDFYLEVVPNDILFTLAEIPEGTEINIGDYYDGEKFIAVRNFPGSISKTILSANAIDSIEISTLPNPCTITVNSDTYEVTDGVFEFTVDTPGTYIIKAECFPYQPKEWEVTAE